MYAKNIVKYTLATVGGFALAIGVGVKDKNSIDGFVQFGATDAQAQSLHKVASKEYEVASVPQYNQPTNNLGSYGIPNVDGMRPFKTNRMDLTDKISGKETLIEMYQIDGAFLAFYSIGGKKYSVAFDKDRKKPMDVSVMDFNGDGDFSPVPSNKSTAIPDWVIR